MTIRNSNTRPARSIFLLTASSGMLLGIASWAVVALQHGGNRAVAGQDVAAEQEVKSNAPATLNESTDTVKVHAPTPELDNGEWLRPEIESVPLWLVSGGEAEKRLGKVALSLEKTVTAQFEGVPLTELASELSEQASVTIVVNSTELDAFGVDEDTPVLVQVGGKTTLREVLRIALTPLELTWRVTESGLEITSIDDAEASPLSRVYDLTYVLPNASNRDSLMNTIQQTIAPDAWLANGGSSNLVPIGSCIVVSAPESAHYEVAKLLHSLSAMNPANLRTVPPTPEHPQHMPYMGGGMGGMGMGGGAAGGMGGGAAGGMGGGMFRSGAGNNAKQGGGAAGGY